MLTLGLWSSLEKELQALLKETKAKQSKFRQVVEECIQNVHRVEQLEEDLVLQSVVFVLITGLESKESKVVTSSLSSVEFLLSHGTFDDTYGDQLLNFLETQLASQIESKHKLKSLQVLILFCSYCVKQKYPDCDYLFRGLSILLKCLRDELLQPEWKAATEAGFRQIVSEAFEVVRSQDSNTSLNELTPSMTSAYLLFQDLCRMVSKSTVSNNRLAGHPPRRSLVYQILMDCIRSPAFIENIVFKQLLLEVFPQVLSVENLTEIGTDDLSSFLMLFVDYLQLYIKILPEQCVGTFHELFPRMFDLFQVSDDQSIFLVSYISSSSNILDAEVWRTSCLTIFKDLFSFFTRLVPKIPQNVFSSNDSRIDAQVEVVRILPNVIDTKYQRAFLILKIIQRTLESFSIAKNECRNTFNVWETIVRTILPMIQEILRYYSRHHQSSLLHFCYIETWRCIIESLKNMQMYAELNELLKYICGVLREDLLPLKDHWNTYPVLVRKHISSLLPLIMDVVKCFVFLKNSDENNSSLSDFFSLVFLLDFLSSQDNVEDSRKLSSDLNDFFGELLRNSSAQQTRLIVSQCFHEIYRECTTYTELSLKKKPRMDQIFLQRLLWLGECLERVDTSLKKFLLSTCAEFAGNLMTDNSVPDEIQITGVNIIVKVIHLMIADADIDAYFHCTDPFLLELFRSMIVLENIVVFDRVLQAITDILQSYSHILDSVHSWNTLLEMLYEIPMKEDFQLIIFRLITILSKDFISCMPYDTECLHLWSKILCRCIQSLKDLNLSLTCLGYIWNTIDSVSRHWRETEIDKSKLVYDTRQLELYYSHLASIMTEICVLTRDGRPEIRNSTLRMIIDVVKVAASKQFPGFWKQNQWDESRIIFLEGIVKLFYQFWVVQFVLRCLNNPRTELCKAGVDMMMSVFDCFCDQEAIVQDVINGQERSLEIMFWERFWKIIEQYIPRNDKYEIDEANVPSFLTLMNGLKNLLRNSRHSFVPFQAKILFDMVMYPTCSLNGLKNEELFISAIDFFREASFDNESDCWNVLFEELLNLCRHCLETRMDHFEYSTKVRLSLEAIENTFQKDSIPVKPRVLYIGAFVELLLPCIEQYSFEDLSKSALALDSLKALVVVVKSCVLKDFSFKDLDLQLFDRIVGMAENFISIKKKGSETTEGYYTAQPSSEYEIEWRKESYDIVLVDLLASRLLVYEELLTEISWKKTISLLRTGFNSAFYEDQSHLRFRHACRISLLKWIQNQSRNKMYPLSLPYTKCSVIQETKLNILNNTLRLIETLVEERLNGGSYPLSSAICLEIQDVFQCLLKYETLSILERDAFEELNFPRTLKQGNDTSVTTVALRKALISLRERLSTCCTLELSYISELAVCLLKDMDNYVFLPNVKGFNFTVNTLFILKIFILKGG
ncbi:Protein MON2 [Galdieria sulphuraria]|nr:Protein MON2 [Galdieria sulphuraria]